MSREERAAVVAEVEASLALEGLEMSPEARGLYERFIEGELEAAELGPQIRALHGVEG